MSESKMLYIHMHLGIGDLIDCNALVRVVENGRTGYDCVGVFVKKQYTEMFEYMWRDNPRILIVPIDGENEYNSVADFMNNTDASNTALMTIGHKNYKPELEYEQNLNCWEQFYMQLEIPSQLRWEAFYLQEDKVEQKRLYDKLNPSNEKYIFLHDDPSRGFEIDRKKINLKKLKIIENDITENIFYYIDIIKNAEEIHCMESSFKSLVELIGTSAKLYFHDFRGHPLGDNSARSGWKIINYQNKE